LTGFLVSKVFPSEEADHWLLLSYQLGVRGRGRGTDMKIPVGTLWDVPNGVFTSAYVDIVLLYVLVRGFCQDLIAVFSI
jgi:hypothetical protein